MMNTILSALGLAIVCTFAIDLPQETVEAKSSDPTATCSLSAEAEYVGANACRSCHFVQWKTWKKTSMAKTFDVLKPGKAKEAKAKFKLDPAKDYTKDASCLPCHTTGYGKAGGYPALVEGKAWSAAEKKLAKDREGVQCESCHGPGSLSIPFKKKTPDYKRADLLKLGITKPDKDNCTSCHNAKSPTVSKDHPFDYDKAVKQDKQIHKHKALGFKH